MTDNAKPAFAGTCEAPCSASLTVQHERWAADRWKVMLRVNRMAFQIGAECDTREAADRLRDDFAGAMNALGVEMPNTEMTGGTSRASGVDGKAGGE